MGPEKGQQPDLPSSAAVNRGRWKWDGKEQAMKTAGASKADRSRVLCCSSEFSRVEAEQRTKSAKRPKAKSQSQSKD